MEYDEIQSLREALRSSPDNLPLRKLLAQALLKHKRFAEAEIELKEVLKMNPQDARLQLGLAESFFGQEKVSMALVIVEEMVSKERPPAATFLLYAKLLLKTKQAEAALENYEKAVLVDPNLKDALLESEIKLKAQQSGPQEPEKIKLTHGGPDEDSDQEQDGIDIERPKVTFEDVGGMDDVKSEINLKIIAPLTHGDIYKAYGMSIGGGVLLYGPPGCGKTHIARATAGEVNINFIPVGISDILDMYIGSSERNLHQIFEKARDLKPCVLFFDEVDALGAKRSDMRQSAGRHLINQFLNEMDGVNDANDGVLILAATNAPWHLDSAFRRPGRFDNIIFVPPPDAKAREEILRILLKDKPTGEIRYEKIVSRSEGLSGADMKAIVETAIKQKIAEAMRTGKPSPLQTEDLLQATKAVRPSTKEWFSTAKNYALFSNESGHYDEILKYLNIRK